VYTVVMNPIIKANPWKSVQCPYMLECDTHNYVMLVCMQMTIQTANITFFMQSFLSCKQHSSTNRWTEDDHIKVENSILYSITHIHTMCAVTNQNANRFLAAVNGLTIMVHMHHDQSQQQLGTNNNTTQLPQFPWHAW